MHQQRHQRPLEHFLKDNRVWLAAMPLALFSVSLAAALDDIDSRLEARRLLDELADDCGLKPRVVRCIAGALRYTEYDYLKRQLMRMIAHHYGRTTDPAEDVDGTGEVAATATGALAIGAAVVTAAATGAAAIAFAAV